MELIFTAFAFIIVTVVASLIFYRKIREATTEYEGASESIHNITSGFSRQVSRLNQDITKLEGNSSTAKAMAAEAIKASSDAKQATLIGLEAVKTLKDKVDSNQGDIEILKKDVQRLIESPKSKVVIQPTRREITAAIPVQQQGILSRLTDTELTTLKKIVELGEGTVPEIKAYIGLTREHTARMMKKLYESGYVDRSTIGMPYRYSVRKEIYEIIQQHEEKTPL